MRRDRPTSSAAVITLFGVRHPVDNRSSAHQTEKRVLPKCRWPWFPMAMMASVRETGLDCPSVATDGLSLAPGVGRWIVDVSLCFRVKLNDLFAQSRVWRSPKAAAQAIN